MTVPRGAFTRRRYASDVRSDSAKPVYRLAEPSVQAPIATGFPAHRDWLREIADTVDTRRTWSLTASIVTSPGRRTYRRPHHTAQNDVAQTGSVRGGVPRGPGWPPWST